MKYKIIRGDSQQCEKQLDTLTKRNKIEVLGMINIGSILVILVGIKRK